MTQANDSNGFTLIEVVIALMIFSIGILAMQGLQLTSVKTNFAALTITRAIGQGIDTVERILALDYTNDLLLAGNHDDTEFPDEWAHTKNTSINWEITDNEPMPHMKTVDLVITSIERGSSKTLAITYYKAELL